MIENIKREYELNVKESTWLMDEQEYSAKELVDHNIENIEELIECLKKASRQNAEGAALAHTVRDLIEDALFVANIPRP
jgi:LPS O-antigen subunit length determinant protein (WzzB/FepE family)